MTPAPPGLLEYPFHEPAFIFVPMDTPRSSPRPRKRVLRKLSSKYRLLVINDRTFEERFSIRLSRMNVLLLAMAAFALVALLVTTAIMFTPLKRLVPGYSDHDLQRFAHRSTVMADSLERLVPIQAAYIENLRMVLSGEITADSVAQIRPVQDPPTVADLAPSMADSLLRLRMAREEAYSLAEGAAVEGGRRQLAGIVFFPPVRGVVTEGFGRQQGHFGVDIVTKADEAVKAALDGTVTLATWTSDGGHMIVVQHANDLMTLYKHNAVVLKKAGDRVKAGEAIAIVGDSGELTNGPHLHFELWLAGEPIDPQAYMVFE